MGVHTPRAAAFTTVSMTHFYFFYTGQTPSQLRSVAGVAPVSEQWVADLSGRKSYRTKGGASF